ncbi:Vitamin B6 transporter [Vermiconidia calcicola]|uniref:Vitamin B6 transporter n=1 Tax=Vermiconidia calcicola TaxID=1690605 RepID=A0ACC3P107_9PEZI|nr:Vitamin B6 transporter [Vermiconidia calcicola]
MFAGQDDNPGIDRTASRDIEKIAPVLAPETSPDGLGRDAGGNTASSIPFFGPFQNFERMLVRYNLESRGIQRVLPAHRHTTDHLGFIQVCMLWVSINLTANNITLGMLGPAVFFLSFRDSCLTAVFGMLIGCLPVAYIATFGPRSGNRTMVLTRYIMGWWPTKIIVVLTLVILLGYCLIDVVVAGQILSAVSTNNSLSIVVGIIITGILAWIVTTFGYSVFHQYQRYAWLPQLIANMILAGVAGPRFDLYSDPSSGLDSRTVAGNRLSFFSLCLAAAITYSETGADFFVYYPENSSKTKMFGVTVIGLAISFTTMFVIGIGLGSGIASSRAWSDAYDTSQGALIVEGLRPLGSFGSFCSVVIALGLISNLVAPTYASGIDWQVLGHHFEKVPRVVWNTFSVVIYTVCAIAGRANLAEIFTNFLALMGYWVSIWIAIVLEEHIIFRKFLGLGWNWDAWNDRHQLPLGIAALVAFVVGWVGAILCMAQVWYIGPISGLIGDYGGDLGNYVGFAWAAIVYAPLRWFELRKFGR